MTSQDQSGSRFIVDLGDVKLPPIVERQVEAKIQAVVLRALAESNVSGQRAEQGRIPPSIWDSSPGRTLGLWPDYPDNPPDIFGDGGWGPLVVEDHTIIMKAIMENPLQVIRYLPSEYKSSKTSPRPSGTEVLQAALQVNEIDNYVKGRIRAVLDILPQIEEAQADLPQTLKRSVDDLQQQLANKTVEEKRSLLRDAGFRGRYRGQGGLAEGMDVAARILEDGQDSIYSPEHSFYTLLAEGQELSRAAARDAISDIGSADTIGATAGGAIGSAAGGVGAGPGAVAGGAGASVGAAVAHAAVAIWDAIF